MPLEQPYQLFTQALTWSTMQGAAGQRRLLPLDGPLFALSLINHLRKQQIYFSHYALVEKKNNTNNIF